MDKRLPGVEDLPQMAALALRTAPECCTGACHDYHAVWGFLRLFGRLPAVTADDAFLTSALSAAVESGARRVLVCGSADHGLLAYVLAAFDAAGARPDVTVIDLCPTPLVLCRSYANMHGHQITTAATDALSFTADPFDLVVAHNFLNFFNPQARAALVAQWAGLLTPGGRIVSCTTVKPGAPDRSRRFEPREAGVLADRLATDRTASPHAGLIDEARLRELANGFAEKRESWNVTSLGALEGYFRDAGLKTEAQSRENPGGMTETSLRNKLRVGLVARHASASASQ